MMMMPPRKHKMFQTKLHLCQDPLPTHLPIPHHHHHANKVSFTSSHVNWTFVCRMTIWTSAQHTFYDLMAVVEQRAFSILDASVGAVRARVRHPTGTMARMKNDFAWDEKVFSGEIHLKRQKTTRTDTARKVFVVFAKWESLIRQMSTWKCSRRFSPNLIRNINCAHACLHLKILTVLSCGRFMVTTSFVSFRLSIWHDSGEQLSCIGRKRRDASVARKSYSTAGAHVNIFRQLIRWSSLTNVKWQ